MPPTLAPEHAQRILSLPFGPDPGYRHDHDGDGGGRGFGPPGGGGTSPAPSTAAARAVPAARIGDARVQRLAEQYLEPLSRWCLVALGVYTLALAAAGTAGLPAFVPPVALGVAAALLRPAREGSDEPEAHEPDPEPRRPAAPAPGSLWAREH